jgi:cytochrome c-type biogenesis protein CcmH/NrfG
MRQTTAILALVCISAAELGAADSPAQALVRGGHWKRARAMAEARLSTNPKDVEVACLLGNVELEFGDLDSAQSVFEKAVAMDAQHADCHFLLARV